MAIFFLAKAIPSWFGAFINDGRGLPSGEQREGERIAGQAALQGA
jgi:hypothetical protein